jgi:hypothetical protein
MYANNEAFSRSECLGICEKYPPGNSQYYLFANILSIFPSFHVLTDTKKFLYLVQWEEYDIVEVIERGVNEMYNRRNDLIDK